MHMWISLGQIDHLNYLDSDITRLPESYSRSRLSVGRETGYQYSLWFEATVRPFLQLTWGFSSWSILVKMNYNSWIQWIPLQSVFAASLVKMAASRGVSISLPNLNGDWEGEAVHDCNTERSFVWEIVLDWITKWEKWKPVTTNAFPELGLFLWGYQTLRNKSSGFTGLFCCLRIYFGITCASSDFLWLLRPLSLLQSITISEGCCNFGPS